MITALASTFADIGTDLRYGLRGLRRSPGYAVTVVLTLALGLGAVSTMLAIVDSVLLRPVALPAPEQLVMLSRKGQDGTDYELSYKHINALRRESRTLLSVSGYTTFPKAITTTDGARVALVTTVTSGFFSTLGVRAELGRLLGPADQDAPLTVVSAAFWRERMHADPKAIGAPMKLSGQLRTVVGVLPDGIHFPQGIDGPVVYTLLPSNVTRKDDLFSGDAALVVARMRPGVHLEQARAEAASILAHADTDTGSRHDVLQVRSYAQFLTGDLRPGLLALLGGVGVLLLIACANAANLQIARATDRMADMNVRSALGASFARLVQQVLTESVLLSLCGAALGGTLACVLVSAIRRSYGQQFARFDELAVHPEVIGACALLAIVAGVLASLAPMFGIRHQTGARLATTRTTRRSRVPGLLVALQIALTCVLLVTSGLFIRTFRALQEVRLGFDPRGVTTLVLTPEDQHKNPEASRQQIALLLERFTALPGVQSAAMQTSIPFSTFNISLNGTTDVSGRAFQKDDSAEYSFVSTNFVRASGMHLLAGREFLEQDGPGAAPVAIVNQAFVKKFLPGRDPLGVRLKSHVDPGDKDSDIPFPQPLTIIGVVENEVQGGDLGAPYLPILYVDYRQLPPGSIFGPVFSLASEFAVRSTLPNAALARELRAAFHQVAPDLTEMNLQPMQEGVTRSLRERRLALRLVAGFGSVALLLAAIGIYGVLAYAVVDRRREIGIRMALGSSRAGATRLVARQACGMVLLGLVIGAAAAWPVGRAVRSLLFGVGTLDPWTISAVAAALLLVCALAAVAPAWRAAQVEPMEALRAE